MSVFNNGVDDIQIEIIHGEQRHHPRINSINWGIQHTWCKLTYRNIVIYVDPTSQQFQDIYDDIPDYYISLKKPKWYFSDRDNIAWNGITRVINKHVKIKMNKSIYGEIIRVNDGIIEYLQHEIWGRISNIIRRYILRITDK